MSAATERILDFSEAAAHLRVADAQLLVERDRQIVGSIPLSDVAIVILSHPALSYTHAVMQWLARSGAAVLICDGNSLPLSLCLPLFNHSLQAQRIQQQIATSMPTKKRLWQHLVRAKIRAQALTLKRLRGIEDGLMQLSDRVRSGDPDNIEAQAARRYWRALFNGTHFRRDPDGPPPNNALNYGYAVLRAMVARAVCASALNPTLGLHHHHRDNSFCLADDLMEPFRPVVDLAVGQMMLNGEICTSLTSQNKQRVLTPLLGHFALAGERRSLFDILTRITTNLAEVFSGKTDSITLPEPDDLIR